MLCYRFSLYTKDNPHRPIHHMYLAKFSSVKKLITEHHAKNYVCIVELGDWLNEKCDDEFV